MKPRYLVYLAALLVAAIAFFVIRPTGDGHSDDVQVAAPPAPAAPAAPAVDPGALFLPDGSLNLMYRPEQTRGGFGATGVMLGPVPAPLAAAALSGPPGALYFPFFDATDSGVGLMLTQGWHYLGSAEMALQSNAHPATYNDGWSFGLPAMEDTERLRLRPLDAFPEWIRARRWVAAEWPVITGVYTQQGDALRLTVLALDGAASPTILIETPIAAGTTLIDHLALQRRLAHESVAAAVSRGILPASTAARVDDALFEDQLGRAMGAAGSVYTTWVHEGINRALLLARSRPDRAAQALQVAAFGHLMLTFNREGTYGDVGDLDFEVRDGLRLAALSQVVHRLNPNCFGGAMFLRMGVQIAGFHVPGFALPGPPPQPYAVLAAFENNDLTGIFTEQAPSYPTSLVLNFYERGLWMYGRSNLDDWYIKEHRPAHPASDMHRVIEKHLLRRARGSGFAARAELADELSHREALYLIADVRLAGTSAQRNALAAALNARQLLPPGDTLAPASPDVAENSATATLVSWMPRRSRVRARWHSLQDPGSPMSQLMAAFAEAGQLAPPGPIATAGSGFAGLDYPIERRVFHRLESLDIELIERYQFIRNRFGSDEQANAWRARVAPFMAGRVAGHMLAVELEHNDEPTAEETLTQLPALRALARDHGGYPAAIEPLLYAHIRIADVPGYVNVLRHYERRTAFRPEGQLTVARTLMSFGARRLAIERYQRYIDANPKRYDIVNEAGFARLQLREDLDYDAIFRTGANQLVGNSELVGDYMSYLVYTAKDFERARDVLRVVPKPGFWPMEVAEADGDTSTVLRLLDEQLAMNDPSENPVSKAARLADLAQWYLHKGEVARARQALRAAEQIDSWQGNVIAATFRLALHDKNWAKAFAQIKRYEERYGVGDNTVLWRARFEKEQGRHAEAIAILENRYRERPAASGLSQLLVECYIALDRRADLERFAEFLDHHPGRNRWDYEKRVETIRAKYPDLADTLAARQDAVMAGPATLDELADWARRPFPAAL
jgi:tetratricopeptide (TPR) repeat protein